MMTHTWTDKRRSFVTNLRPDKIDIERLLRVASQLDLPAWIGDQVNGFDGTVGFYVHYRVKDLSEFWKIINSRV